VLKLAGTLGAISRMVFAAVNGLSEVTLLALLAFVAAALLPSEKRELPAPSES